MLIISLKNTERCNQHSHAHSLLRVCLAKKNIEYNENTPITKNKLGKPSLAEHPEIQYNLTHAEGIAACIVSDCECGIDAEKIRPYRPNVIRRVFSEAEKAEFESTPDELKDKLFFSLWTLKEAYVKALGIGVSYPMNTAEFHILPDEIRTNIEGYSFRLYEIKEQFLVAVCEKM